MSNQPLNTNTSQTNATPQASPQINAQKLSAKEIHGKWDKISEQEASGMKQTSDLISQVQAKYSLNADQAQRDVNAWANGRSF